VAILLRQSTGSANSRNETGLRLSALRKSAGQKGGYRSGYHEPPNCAILAVCHPTASRAEGLNERLTLPVVRDAAVSPVRFKTRRRDVELQFGPASRLSQDRGSCVSVCCTSA